jgi:two-component system CheB/CheR fusion protein
MQSQMGAKRGTSTAAAHRKPARGGAKAVRQTPAVRRRAKQERSAQRLASAALEHYTELFDFAPIGYATLDTNGRIVELNHAGARLLGGERARFIGSQFAAYVSLEGLRRYEALVTSALTRPAPMNTELELRQGAMIISVRVTAGSLRNGEPRVLLAFDDISDRRAMEAAHVGTEQALRDINRRKDDFLAMLSHELRNPLSPIRTSVAVLRLVEPGSDAAVSAIDMIDRSTTHLIGLVDALLDVTRITRGTIELQRAPVELVALIAGTIDDRRDELSRRRLLVETHFGVPELWVSGDRMRLVQMLGNVLTNAEKFTPAGGKITVSLDRVNTSAVLRIKDTGVGIAPEVIADLFEPFSQGPQPLDRARGGLGLGLTMVKALVELHGGRIAVRSGGIGKGSEVVLTLAAEALDHAAMAPTAATERRSRRVLIVEDMHDTAHSLQHVLQLKGHQVDVAYDGRSGLDKVDAFRPEIVLCDLGLPDLDGFAFAMNVRARTGPQPYLVALSGYARPEDVASAKAAGFDRHLAKPPQLEELAELLATVQVRPAEPHEGNTL